MLSKSHSLSRIILAIVLLLSITAATTTAAVHQTVQVQVNQTKPFPQTQYIPDHDFDSRHLALDIRFDWDKEQLIGRETLVFAPLVPNLRSISLDAANITATSVKLSSGTTLQFNGDAPKEKLNITLDRAYQPSDELTMVIDYHTNGPQDPKRTGLVGVGLRFIKPSSDDPKRPKQIWSQGESEYNHYWFPCYDHPNDFFTSEITATVDKHSETVTLSGDKAAVQKAADALVAAGYFGKSSDAGVKINADSGVSGKKVQTLKIEGVHLCCGKCVSSVDKAVKSVAGVKEHTAKKNADSFEVTGDFNDKDVIEALHNAGLNGKVAK